MTTLTPEKCRYLLIHPGHEWTAYEPASDDPGEDAYVPVDVWCEGNADQDDPMDRYECCAHCASRSCPRRDGHLDPCTTPACTPGHTMTGAPEGA